MKNEELIGPEVSLLNSITDEELSSEKDEIVKELVRKKARNDLYPLLSLFGTKNLDQEEIKKKIKRIVEE